VPNLAGARLIAALETGDVEPPTVQPLYVVAPGRAPALRAALTPPAVTEEAAAEQKCDEKNDHPGFHGFLRRMNDETVFLNVGLNQR
jgi:hypothetical protein